MISVALFSSTRTNHTVSSRAALCGILLLVAALSACSVEQDKTQVLARVNGEEITLRQIKQELLTTGGHSMLHSASTRQLLDALIDRRLLTDAAMSSKLDRSPEVALAIERANADIISKAYLSSIDSKIARPSMGEICDYYQQHPQYFAERKQFVIQQIVIASKDVNKALMSTVNSAASLDAVAAWLNKQNIRHVRGQISRSSTDLPEQMAERLKNIHKGEIFLVQEGENSLLNAISDISTSPVTAKNAEAQIEMFLLNKKIREAREAEISQLRSFAKIEYLNPDAFNTR